jgi:hypothetical protein
MNGCGTGIKIVEKRINSKRCENVLNDVGQIIRSQRVSPPPPVDRICGNFMIDAKFLLFVR